MQPRRDEVDTQAREVMAALTPPEPEPSIWSPMEQPVPSPESCDECDGVLIRLSRGDRSWLMPHKHREEAPRFYEVKEPENIDTSPERVDAVPPKKEEGGW